MSIRRITPNELSVMLTDHPTPIVIDVRSDSERASFGWIDGSINILPSDIPAYLKNSPPERTRPLIVVCQTGARSAHASQLLADAGVENVYDLAGGMLGWMLLRLPLRR